MAIVISSPSTKFSLSPAPFKLKGEESFTIYPYPRKDEAKGKMVKLEAIFDFSPRVRSLLLCDPTIDFIVLNFPVADEVFNYLISYLSLPSPLEASHIEFHHRDGLSDNELFIIIQQLFQIMQFFQCQTYQFYFLENAFPKWHEILDKRYQFETFYNNFKDEDAGKELIHIPPNIDLSQIFYFSRTFVSSTGELTIFLKYKSKPAFLNQILNSLSAPFLEEVLLLQHYKFISNIGAEYYSHLLRFLFNIISRHNFDPFYLHLLSFIDISNDHLIYLEDIKEYALFITSNLKNNPPFGATLHSILNLTRFLHPKEDTGIISQESKLQAESNKQSIKVPVNSLKFQNDQVNVSLLKSYGNNVKILQGRVEVILDIKGASALSQSQQLENFYYTILAKPGRYWKNQFSRTEKYEYYGQWFIIHLKSTIIPSKTDNSKEEIHYRARARSINFKTRNYPKRLVFSGTNDLDADDWKTIFDKSYSQPSQYQPYAINVSFKITDPFSYFKLEQFGSYNKEENPEFLLLDLDIKGDILTCS